MKKMMILTLMLCSVYFVHAGEPDHLGDRFTSIEIYGDPFVPALSSFRWARGLDLFKSADNINSFQLEIWTLTDTAYLLPLPFFNFFELGFQLSYYPFVTPDSLLRAGAIVYLVDQTINFNIKLGLQIGMRRSK